MTGRGLASDRQIQLRRRQEEQLAAAESAVGVDRSLRQYAKWETRTHQKIKANELVRRMDTAQGRHDETLEKRRRRLAELLQREKEMYEAELEDINETQEQRRDRIAEQALGLRAEREKLRNNFANEQRERAFRSNCPQLIEANSRANLLQVSADRSQQLEWNEQKKKSEKREESYYDALWNEDRERKEQRAISDLTKQRNMKIQLQETLATQKMAQKRDKEARKEAERIEGEQFKADLIKGAKEDAERELRRREHQHELGRLNKQYNMELEQMRSEVQRKELETDKKLLSDLLEKVKEDEEKERESKRQSRIAAVAHMKEVEKQMMTAAGAETELDRLWQIESNKEWDKREAKWKAEQDKRDTLLRDTFRERGLQVQQNREKRLADKTKGETEREDMIRDIEKLQKKEKEQATKRFEVAKNYQKCLIEQANSKREEQDAERRGRDLELIACQIAERDYQRKVANERAAIESRKPPQYAHVSISSRREF
eukprot:TRINITY_DN16659_c0_g2_i1.p1 TRINITY_DN16659_c0_g2~~TRINITY_DN16659_c0_g2_i1.p1  ORF type:complete len:510 (+),score=132.67 TRINITY_DN16659_c0_g2_i1:64-1530(+)